MKKIMKITGKIVKWYVISDILLLAFTGGGEIVEAVVKNPKESIMDLNLRVYKNAAKKWNLLLGRYKET